MPLKDESEYSALLINLETRLRYIIAGRIGDIKQLYLKIGGFHYFFMFTHTWGNDPRWTSYFFRWVVQPPTRYSRTLFPWKILCSAMKDSQTFLIASPLQNKQKSHPAESSLCSKLTDGYIPEYQMYILYIYTSILQGCDVCALKTHQSRRRGRISTLLEDLGKQGNWQSSCEPIFQTMCDKITLALRIRLFHTVGKGQHNTVFHYMFRLCQSCCFWF